jgi:hypothetical protein
MKNLFITIMLLVNLIYACHWNRQAVYVNPDDVQGVIAFNDLWDNYAKIELKQGNFVISHWSVQQVVDALNAVQKK